MFAAEMAPHPRRGVARVIERPWVTTDALWTAGENRRNDRIGPESTIGGEKGKVVRGLRPRSKLETKIKAREAPVGRSHVPYRGRLRLLWVGQVVHTAVSPKCAQAPTWFRSCYLAMDVVHSLFFFILAAYLVVFVVVMWMTPV
jgi:hypothetical protein